MIEIIAHMFWEIRKRIIHPLPTPAVLRKGRPKDWLEGFVLKHESRLYRITAAILGNKADTGDILQD